ncbi:MAG TPA: DUF4421 domain-containing protein [Phnomibacter sp.]|nr:DUF4421 domain-containing protein [Phnomibacter sp.]
MKHLLLSLIGCCLITIAVAQTGAKDSSAPRQKEWIEAMDNYINLRLSQNRDVEEFVVDQGNQRYVISPNISSITRLGFSYRFLSFGYNFIAKFLPGNDDDDIRGSTKASGYDLGFNFSKWQQELSYSKTKGFYLENTSDFNPSWQQGDPYLLVPNLEYKNFQGFTGYKFNPNFSFPALVSQTERQLKSAGTLMPTLLYRYFIIDDKTALTGTNSSQKSNSFEALIGIGYYYTFVVNKNFYLALGVRPAAGMVFTKLTTRLPSGNTVTHQDNFVFRMNARAGVGYNGERFFAGIYARAFGSTETQENSTVVNYDSRIAAQAFVGYRFNAPKWLKKNVEKVETLSPF